MRTLVLAQAARLADFLPSVGFVLIVARHLGPEDFGRYAIAFNVSFVCSAVLPPSLTELFGRHLASGEFAPGSVLGRGLALRVPFGAIGIVLALTAMMASGIDNRLLLAGGIVTFVSLEVVGFTQSAAAGLLAYETLVLWRIVGRSTSLALAIGLAVSGSLDPVSALLALAVGQFITALGTLIGIAPRIAISSQGRRMGLFEVRRFAIETWFAAILTIGLGTQKDVLILGFLGASAGQIGAYSVAATLLVQLALLLTGGWVPASLPILARLRGSHDEFGHEWRRLVLGWAIVIAPSFAALAIAASQLIPTLFGAAFGQASAPLVVFALGYAASALVGGSVNQLALYAKDHSSDVLAARSIGLAANITLAIILIPGFGATGAAAATAISVGLVFLLELHRVIARTDHRLPARRIATIVGLTSMTAVLGAGVGIATSAWLIGAIIAFAGFWLTAVATRQLTLASIAALWRETHA